jgi:hypothetical protein
MSDFYNPAITRKAAKEHRCTYCGEVIAMQQLKVVTQTRLGCMG